MNAKARLSAQLLFVAIALICYHLWIGSVWARTGAAIHVPETRYRFDPVPEGRAVEHTFILGNNGDSPLRILKAEATCSCTHATFDETIAPGGRGRVHVVVETDGDGGRDVAITVAVQTSDPAQPVIRLELAGHVEKLMEVTPPIVRLQGPAGKPLTRTVTIRPAEKYPFSIVESKARKGEHLTYRLARKNLSKQPDGYDLTVTVTGNQKGRYFDKIVLTTDSPHKPEIVISIFAHFV